MPKLGSGGHVDLVLMVGKEATVIATFLAGVLAQDSSIPTIGQGQMFQFISGDPAGGSVGIVQLDMYPPLVTFLFL